MKLNTLICASMLAVTAAGAPSYASNLIVLGGAKTEKTVTTIGSAPVKKIKPLNLGKLRTREAQLPGGLLTIADRMKLRAKRALSRQKAVTFASRSKRNQQADKKKTKTRERDQDEIVRNESDEPVLQ